MTYLHHGTSLACAEKILQDGILAARRGSFWGSHLTALEYATSKADSDASEPVIFAVPADRFDPEHLIHDNGNIGVAIANGESLDAACRRMFGADLECYEADLPFGYSWYTTALPVSAADIEETLTAEPALEALKPRAFTP